MLRILQSYSTLWVVSCVPLWRYTPRNTALYHRNRTLLAKTARASKREILSFWQDSLVELENANLRNKPGGWQLYYCKLGHSSMGHEVTKLVLGTKRRDGWPTYVAWTSCLISNVTGICRTRLPLKLLERRFPSEYSIGNSAEVHRGYQTLLFRLWQ